MKADWMAHTTHKDWLIDGFAIVPGELMRVWDTLDWTKAHVDRGPSPAGNMGPYWHVPVDDDETVHRLYPRLLKTKWAVIVERAFVEVLKAERKRAREAAKFGRREAYQVGVMSSPDTERFAWYFGQQDKRDYINEYMRGMREGWTVDQWRASIDDARREK